MAKSLKDKKKLKLRALQKAKERKARFSAVEEEKQLAKAEAKKRATQTPRAAAEERISKLKEKLKGAEFRQINEALYTSSGTEALAMIKENPDVFDAYHAGFRSQVHRWPVNPVDMILSHLQTDIPKKAVVADFGCGEAIIGRTAKQKVHSFDLAARDPCVTVADMTNVPLGDASVDVAVFSLALMSTNFIAALREAHRVLKKGGTLIVSEVRSRFEDNHGIDQFVEGLAELGFDCETNEGQHHYPEDEEEEAELIDQRRRAAKAARKAAKLGGKKNKAKKVAVHLDDALVPNKMFVLMRFNKSKRMPPKDDPLLELRPCLYKRR